VARILGAKAPGLDVVTNGCCPAEGLRAARLARCPHNRRGPASAVPGRNSWLHGLACVRCGARMGRPGEAGAALPAARPSLSARLVPRAPPGRRRGRHKEGRSGN
jgi:hypothetical protein